MKTLKFVTHINSVVAGLQPQVKKKIHTYETERRDVRKLFLVEISRNYH